MANQYETNVIVPAHRSGVKAMVQPKIELYATWSGAPSRIVMTPDEADRLITSLTVALGTARRIEDGI